MGAPGFNGEMEWIVQKKRKGEMLGFDHEKNQIHFVNIYLEGMEASVGSRYGDMDAKLSSFKA